MRKRVSWCMALTWAVTSSIGDGGGGDGGGGDGGGGEGGGDGGGDGGGGEGGGGGWRRSPPEVRAEVSRETAAARVGEGEWEVAQLVAVAMAAEETATAVAVVDPGRRRVVSRLRTFGPGST